MLSLLLAIAGPALAAPATVLEHRVSVTIDGSKRLDERVTWVVRIDDPAACAAGVPAPPGLDGASDQGALVLEDLFVIPPQTTAGATFTLRGRQRGGRGSHSGLVVGSQDLPVQQASLVVSAPSWVPLTVWADPDAQPSADGAHRVRMSWTEVPAGQLHQAVWSTHEGWDAAANSVTGALVRKLGDKGTLGRDLGADITGLGLAGISERVYQHLAVDAGGSGTWQGARGAGTLARVRSGTAAERGVLLLSMLRIAGHDAKPAVARPAALPGAFPVTVPAPALLTRPIVVVDRPEGRVYIDPAADRAAVPDLPASLLDATVWVPGELPHHVQATGPSDGAVHVSTALTITGDGASSWSASIQATGTAQELLRDRLAPLDEAGQTEAFLRLVRSARPDALRVHVSVTGAHHPAKRLKITVAGSEDAALQPVGYGLRGPIAPALAAALGAWLPPRIAIREQVAIKVPATVQVLGTAVAPPAYTPQAVVSRSLTRQGRGLVLTADVLRPQRRGSPGSEATAAAFLAEDATRGADLLLLTSGGATVRGLRSAPQLTPADRAVLETLLWWSEDSERKARKVLIRAAPKVGFEVLTAGLGHWSDPSDLRPWIALSEVADTDAHRLTVAEGLRNAGALRAALRSMVALSDSDVPSVQVRALLARERLQGPKPDPAVDPERAAWWESPDRLLQRARDVNATDPALLLRLAQAALQAGDPGTAEVLLQQAPDDALAQALAARAGALGGLPASEVRQRAAAAAAADPHSAEVRTTAAAALERVGDTDGALAAALSGARMSPRDPHRWDQAARLALAAGDLAQATAAAHTASDLDPTSRARAQRWAALALLSVDRAQTDEARARAGEPPIEAWPPSLDTRISLAPDALLAVLRHADRAVLQAPGLLAMRAQLQVAAGALDAAARDGVVLATHHDNPEGWALAFAATAGRQYSAPMRAALDRAARSNPTARTTRMEYRLISGSGDALADAAVLAADDPRAAALIGVSRNPRDTAAAIPGWPETVPEPASRPPRAWRRQRALSSVPGVTGWSRPDTASAIVRVGAVTGILPPPLGSLYTAHPRVLERLASGGQVLRLDGGVIPLYAATTVSGGQEVYGVAFTVQGAKRALEVGLR